MNGTFPEAFYWVWLQQVLGAGSSRLPEVLVQFSNAKHVYEAKSKTATMSKLFRPAEIGRMQKLKDDDVLKILTECQNRKIGILTPNNKAYPERVGNIHNPPVVLYYRGILPDVDNEPMIAIVGPRTPTEFGKKAAYSLAAKLAMSGMPIVSGGALGTDSLAHLGALKVGGVTLCVLGCGIDYSYLMKSEPIRRKMEEKGCVISEYPPLTRPTKYSFPVRNRIISALSVGVVVIEASEKSGSLITAGHANEQGRDVFAIPGNINMPCYCGTNALIRDGARPLLNALDIIDEYIGRFSEKMNPAATLDSIEMKAKLQNGFSAVDVFKDNTARKSQNNKAKPVDSVPFNKPNVADKDLSPAALTVYNTFTDWVESSDDLSCRCGLDAGEFLSALTELELLGFVKAVPVGRYELINLH